MKITLEWKCPQCNYRNEHDCDTLDTDPAPSEELPELDFTCHDCGHFSGFISVYYSFTPKSRFDSPNLQEHTS